MENLIKKSVALFFSGLIIIFSSFIIKTYFITIFIIGFALVFYSLFVQDIPIKSKKYSYNLRSRFRIDNLFYKNSIIKFVRSGIISNKQTKYLLRITSRIFPSKKQSKKIINKVKFLVFFWNKLTLNSFFIKTKGLFKKILMLVFKFSKKFNKLMKKVPLKKEEKVAEKVPINKKFLFFAHLISFLLVLATLYFYLRKLKPIVTGFIFGVILVLLFILIKSKFKKSSEEEKIKNDKIIGEIRHVVSNKVFKTELDTLLEFLNKYNKITLIQISKGFNVDLAIAESWCKILAEANLAEIYYPTIGDTELRKIEAKKEEKNV